MQESPSSVIIIVLFDQPNSKVGSLEIAKIKIAKIISHTFTFKSRKFSSTKISRYTVVYPYIKTTLTNICAPVRDLAHLGLF